MNDVLVIGAGPAGNQTAQALSSQGWSVTVLDYRRRIGDKLCTGIVGRECAERYRVPEELVYRPARSACILPPDGAGVRVERENAQAYVIDRVRFIELLAHRARAAGAQYRLGRRVSGVDVRTGGVCVTAYHDGSPERYEAKAVVIASGFGTHVARVAGLPPAATPGLAAQAVVEGLDAEEIQVYAGGVVPRGFFGWVTPTDGGRSLVGVLGRHDPARALRSLMASIAGNSRSGLTAARPGIWGIPLRPAPRTYGDRLLMVGDAAGQVKPTTGGGIYYSLRSGDLAAQALGEALGEDDLRATSLKRYEDAWMSLLGRELRLGYMARGIYERLGERDLGRLIRLAASNGFLSGDLSFEWHADLVTRALSYKLLDGVLAPVRGISSFVSRRAKV